MRHSLPPLAACMLAVAFALTACGSADDSPATPPKPQPPTLSASPAAWPTLQNGLLTEDMCGVLTAADFKDVGWNGEPDRGQDDWLLSANSIVCAVRPDSGHYQLALAASPEKAAEGFAGDREWHDSRMQPTGTNPADPAENVVPEADESWIDNSNVGKPGTASTVEARKGSLIVVIDVNGSGAEARAAIVELAGRILQRTPQIAATTAEKPHLIEYTITGKGAKTADIRYDSPDGKGTKNVTGAELPWSLKIQFPPSDQGATPYSVSASSAGALTCEVTIDREKVATGNAQDGCAGTFKEPW